MKMGRSKLAFLVMTVFIPCLPFFSAGAEDLSSISLLEVSDWLTESSEPCTVEGSGDYAGVRDSSNASLIGNTVYESLEGSTSEIRNSINDNCGIIGINQASGQLNDQSNRRVFVFPSPTCGFDTTWASRSTEMRSNEMHASGAARQDLLENSFHRNVGVIGVNQSAGYLNSQSNSVAVVLGGAVSLTNMELGDLRSSNNLVEEAIGKRSDIIKDAYLETKGIVQVTQSAGDLNILGNNLSLSHREINLR